MWLKQSNGRSYVAKAEMSSTRCVVYSACLSGQSLWLNGDVEHTLCCLFHVSVGGAIWLKQRCRAHVMLFTPRVSVGGACG